MVAVAGELMRLVLRDHHRVDPATALASLDRDQPTPGLPAEEVGLLAAGAAIAAGEPKRAVRHLDGLDFAPGTDHAIVVEALRHLAMVMDVNWFPGGAGAVLEGNELGLIPPAPTATPIAPLAQRLVAAAGFAALTPVWRRIVEDAVRTGDQQTAAQVLGDVLATVQGLAAYNDPLVTSYVALVHADMLWRAGQFAFVPGPLEVALGTGQALGDLFGCGSCFLFQGDWSLEPLSQPETLGLDLGTSRHPASGTLVGADPAEAAKRYEQAARCFGRAGSGRGLAAVELRLGLLDAARGDGRGGAAHAAAAQRLASRAGDGALANLARVHGALLAVAEGDQTEPALVDDLVAWATTDGSTSFVRGLTRLCNARARRWREAGEFFAARAALRLATRLGDGLGSVTEPALVGDELANLYGGANFHLAKIVLADLELDECDYSDATELELLRQGQKASEVAQSAMSLQDPDAIAATLARIEELLGHLPTAADPAAGPSAAFLPMLAMQLRGLASEAAAFVPLYRGVRARERGEPADELFAEARALAAPIGGPVLAVVLRTSGAVEEAKEVTRALLDSGQLPSDMASILLLRTGQPEPALAYMETAEAAGVPPAVERPWERDAQIAEALVALGRFGEGEERVARAIDTFEAQLARLGRDALRVTATDDVQVTRLYTTGVRAALGLALVETAFRRADRCRGIALADLLATDAAAGSDRETIAAVRSWLRAGAELARTFEQVAAQATASRGQVPTADRGATAASTLAVIDAAEAATDDAELALHRAAPALLADRRSPPSSPSIADVQAVLRDDSFVLQFHAFDDELVGWAVTAGSSRACRCDVRTYDLAACARRLHAACSDPASDATEIDGVAQWLATVLLEPFTAELDAHRRVVFAPHGALTLAPLHLLPFRGAPLGRDRVVSYVPAVSVLPRWRDAGGVRLAPALVVGDPDYDRARRLPQLPGARLEARAVASRLSAEPLVGGAARRDAVLDALPDATVLHLATHGLLVEDAPASAELALAAGDALTVPDLLGVDTTVDLAVLSACSSGRGRPTSSGDLIGLTRGMLAAGARDLVVTLWPVDDDAACLTMDRFYSTLATEPDVAAALASAENAVRVMDTDDRQAAMAALRAAFGDDTPTGAALRRDSRPRDASAPMGIDPTHPYFWAPFVHIGI